MNRILELELFKSHFFRHHSCDNIRNRLAYIVVCNLPGHQVVSMPIQRSGTTGNNHIQPFNRHSTITLPLQSGTCRNLVKLVNGHNGWRSDLAALPGKLGTSYRPTHCLILYACRVECRTKVSSKLRNDDLWISDFDSAPVIQNHFADLPRYSSNIGIKASHPSP